MANRVTYVLLGDVRNAYVNHHRCATVTHMSESVGIRALQQHASAVVARAAAGEEIQITDRGRPVARIVPMLRTRAEELIESGRVRPARQQLSLPKPIRLPHGAPTASEVLGRLRADER